MRDILARRREEGTLRELRTPEQDHCFVDFTSNDFLGLGRAADLRHAIELEAARVRQACSALRDPVPYRDANARMFSCHVVTASAAASSDTALMRYSLFPGLDESPTRDKTTRRYSVPHHIKSQSHILSSIALLPVAVSG